MVSFRIRKRRWFTALVLMLLTVLILLSAVTSQVRADSIYLIPDTLGNTTSYAMTVNNGNPVLSYYSKDTGNIVVAICGNPSCETALTVIRPIESIFLQAVAVTVVDGNPVIAYSTLEYPSVSHLRVAACVDPLCSQPPVITTLDAGDFWHMAVTLQNGKALIAYENVSSGTDHNIVKLAICNDAACTAPTIRALSITDGISGGYGMGVGSLNGNPIVVYTTWNATSVINLLQCASPACAESPTVKTVDANVSNPWGITLTVAANTPIITYTSREITRTWLKVATCTDSACDGPIYIHTVDEANSLGNTSVTLVNGLPVIAYVRDGIRIATCLDIVCNYSSSILIADVSHNSPVIQPSQNNPVVSFMQTLGSTQHKLKVYFGGDFLPSQSPTPSMVSTTTLMASLTRTLSSTPPTSTFTLTPSITPTPSLTNTPTLTYTPTPTHTFTPTPITPTSAPSTAPKVNFYTTHTPTLTWSRVTWATGYQIQISVDKNFASAATFTKVLPAGSLAYTTDTLENGTYYWRVKALGSGSSVSTWSNVDSFVISAPP